MLEAINAARGQEAFTLTMILDDPTVESKNVAGHEMSGSEDAEGPGMIAASRKSKCRRLPARRHEDPGTTGRTSHHDSLSTARLADEASVSAVRNRKETGQIARALCLYFLRLDPEQKAQKLFQMVGYRTAAAPRTAWINNRALEESFVIWGL